MNPLELIALLLGIKQLSIPRPLVSPEPKSGLESYNILGEGNLGRITQYGPTGNLTATGTIPYPGRTAAISPDLLSVIPFGSLVKIQNQVYRIEDLTHPRIKNTLDIFSNSPVGLQKDIPYQIIGRDYAGLKYKIPKGR